MDMDFKQSDERRDRSSEGSRSRPVNIPPEVSDLGERSCPRNWNTPLARVCRIHRFEEPEEGQGPCEPPSSCREIEGERRTEPSVFTERWGFSGIWDGDQTGEEDGYPENSGDDRCGSYGSGDSDQVFFELDTDAWCSEGIPSSDLAAAHERAVLADFFS